MAKQPASTNHLPMHSWPAGMLLVASLLTAGCANEPGYCGDMLCRPAESESCTSCAADCGSCAACGDGTCATSMGESCTSCPSDCGSCSESCGNGMCLGGETCSTCPGDCGACSTDCNPTTCSGCCNAGVCDGGTADTACGAGGGVCMRCGDGLMCSAGRCTINPTSRWNVVLHTLTVDTTNYAGAAWDVGGGAADPVVRVRVGSESDPGVLQNGPDNVHMITYTGAPTVTNVRASDLLAFLSFEVSDEDLTDYEFINHCRATVTDATFMGATQTSTCAANASEGRSGFTLTYSLEPF